MGRGVWGQWGRRNDRRGWSLEIGHFVHCQVIQRFDNLGQPGVWEATTGRAFLGEFPTREAAMKACEDNLEHDAKMFFEEWERYIAAKQKGCRAAALGEHAMCGAMRSPDVLRWPEGARSR